MDLPSLHALTLHDKSRTPAPTAPDADRNLDARDMHRLLLLLPDAAARHHTLFERMSTQELHDLRDRVEDAQRANEAKDDDDEEARAAHVDMFDGWEYDSSMNYLMLRFEEAQDADACEDEALSWSGPRRRRRRRSGRSGSGRRISSGG